MRTTRRSRLTESSQDENSHPNTAQKSKGVLSTKTKGLSSLSNISPVSSGKWSEDETCKLMELFDEYQRNKFVNSSIWDMIAKEVKRTPKACRDKIRYLRLSGELKSFQNKAGMSQASVEVASSTTDAPEENNIQALENAIASAELDTSSSDISSSDDWSKEESLKLMNVLASIDQGIFDEIPLPTHEIWKRVASQMDKRSPIACHRQMNKLSLDSKHKKLPTHCKSNSRKSIPWTDEEVTKLEELYEKYLYLQKEAGRKALWKAIAKELGKKAASCRCRYYSLKRAKQNNCLEQKQQTSSDQSVSERKGFEMTSSELKATIHSNNRGRPRWTKEEERILIESFDMNDNQDRDFSTVAERFGRTPAACKKKLHELFRNKKTTTESVSNNVEAVARNAITIPREIPVVLNREKSTSPLSASSHTADDSSSTKGKMTVFDTPTKALIHYVFDYDNNDGQTSKNFQSPKVLSYHQDAMSPYFSPFTPIAKATNSVLQTTWTPLDKSASIDCSLMLELDSLEITSPCDIAINTRKTNEVCDSTDMLDNTKRDQGVDCDRTPIVARAKRKFESHSYDELYHPRSAPCRWTKLSDSYDCPKSVSVHSDPCRYMVKSHDGVAELDELNINVGTSFYQPKKRSSCENKPCTQLHEEIILNIEADDYFDFGGMDSNLDDLFQ